VFWFLLASLSSSVPNSQYLVGERKKQGLLFIMYRKQVLCSWCLVLVLVLVMSVVSMDSWMSEDPG
jgi:hypothetical protein